MASQGILLKSPSDYEGINEQLRYLAGEASPFESTSVRDAAARIRASYVDLSKSLPTVSALSDQLTIEVYADTLAASTVSIPSNITTVLIFARQIATNGKQTLKLNLKGDCLVRFYCSSSCCPFDLTIGTPVGDKVVKVDVPTDAQALTISVDSNDWSTRLRPLRNPLDGWFETPSLADRLSDDGQVIALGDHANDNLAELLQYLLLLAAIWRAREPRTAFDIYTYVAKLTSKVPKAFDLYTRSFPFASSQVLVASDQTAPHVPQLAISSAKQVIDSHLVAVKAFDDAFRDFRNQEQNASNIIRFAKVALEASEDTDVKFAFLVDLARTRYDAAADSLRAATDTFQELYSEIPDARKNFEDGIRKWQTTHIAMEIVQGFMAVATIVGSIAVACVAPPAGAAAVGAAAEIPQIAEGAAQGAKTLGIAAKIMAAVKKLFNKLKPGLEKAGGLVSAVTATLKLLRSLKHISNAESGSLDDINVSVAPGDDLINLNADWDSFGTEMASLYDPLKELNIAGAADYFLLMAKMVLRGKAVLAAQQAVTTTGDAYATVLAQQLMSNRQSERLRAALTRISGNAEALRLLRLSLFQRLIDVRASVALDFQQYIDGVSWYSLDSTQKINLNPLKDVGDLFTDTATLEAAVTQASASLRIQPRVFYLSTAKSATGNSLAALRNNPATLNVGLNFADELKTTRNSIFTVDPTLGCFADFSRVRLLSFQIRLDGVTKAAAPVVSLKVRLGEEMSDLVATATQSQLLISNADRVAHFVTEPSTLGFAYENTDNAERESVAVLDGHIDGATLRPSPFRRWAIKIAPGVDLSGLTSVSLKMVCEVSVLEEW